MSIHKKIVELKDLEKLDYDFSICYGHFNIIHPGHSRYLDHAKRLSEKLIVAIRSDKELDNEMHGRHYSEIDRANGVASIECVDYVLILNQNSLENLLISLNPCKLVLGKEFEKQQTQQISSAIYALNKSKESSVVYHAGETHYASSSLLHSSALDIDKHKVNIFKDVCDYFKISLKSLNERLSFFEKTKLLVIGDTIVDNYVACEAIGMSAEAPVLVVKELENKEFIGGAAVVASHVKALGSTCYYISVVGDDIQSKQVFESLKYRGVDTSIFIDDTRPTTYKTRYMVENQKMFRVSRIKEHQISETIESKIIDKITEIAPNIDGIMVSDFVYGVITPKIINTIRKLSKKYKIKLFGDLQCSSQVGKVTKFVEFDLITPTEKESRVALRDNENGIEWISNKLLLKTKSKNMLMKLGSDGFVAYSNNDNKIERHSFPALTSNPVDVSGAGDSLFAAMSVSLSSGSNLFEASAIGTCMASLAVNELGNIPIDKSKLSSYVDSLFS